MLQLRSIYPIFVLLLFAFLFTSNRAGRPGSWAGAPGDSGTCATCHTTAGAGSISLTGVPANYEAGTTYNMTLTLSDGVAAVGGFQIVATDGVTNALVGTFTPGSGQTLNNVNRLVQSAAAPFAGGSVSWPITWTAPAAGAPANLQFYYAGNAANDNFNNGAGDMGYSGSTGLIPLPVTLSRFEAESLEDGSVSLTWETQSESNSDYFEVQRAENGQASDFKSIGEVSAAGFSSRQNDYAFVDESPIANKNLYYRLKQIDFDGSFTYSSVQSIKVDKMDQVSVYPNPVRQQETLNFAFANTENQETTIRIIDAAGKEVYAAQFQNESTLSIPLPNLSEGIYYAAIYNRGDLSEIKKVLVQN